MQLMEHDTQSAIRFYHNLHHAALHDKTRHERIVIPFSSKCTMDNGMALPCYVARLSTEFISFPMNG